MIYLVVIIGVIIVFRAGGSTPTDDYTASFGNIHDYFSRWNHGVAIGPRAITKALSVTNVFLSGPTGSGKSSSVIIPSAVSVARGMSSIVFNDVSGELYQRTSGYLAAKGYLILRVDFSDASASESFNPLLACKTISDIQKLCLIVIQNSMGESKTEVFWEQSSISLLSLIIRYLVFYAEPKYRTLQNALRLLEKFAVKDAAFPKMILQTKDEELISAFKAMMVVGEKTIQSVIISIRVALNLWNDKEVCKTTATNTIDFAMLRNSEQPVAIFVCNPLKDLAYFRPISALFFQTLFNSILSRIPANSERHIFILLDEFGSMTFPDFGNTICNIRKYRSSLTVCTQDEMMLISRYGQSLAHQIKTNCACQIYLPGQPLHACRELSQALGRYTVTDLDTGASKGTRELLSVDEVRMCKDALVLINNSAPLRVKLVPYFQSFWLRKLSAYKPYPLKRTHHAEPALISCQ